MDNSPMQTNEYLSRFDRLIQQRDKQFDKLENADLNRYTYANDVIFAFTKNGSHAYYIFAFMFEFVVFGALLFSGLPFLYAGITLLLPIVPRIIESVVSLVKSAFMHVKYIYHTIKVNHILKKIQKYGYSSRESISVKRDKVKIVIPSEEYRKAKNHEIISDFSLFENSKIESTTIPKSNTQNNTFSK